MNPRTPKLIKADVDRGGEIVRQLAELKTEFTAIEKRLKQDALDHAKYHQPLADADREGRQWIAAGSKLKLPVILTSDKIVQSFSADSAIHKRIEAASCGRLTDFYIPTITYETRVDDGKAMRKLATDILGEKGPAFIKACLAVDKNGIPKSDIKLAWDAAFADAAQSAEASAVG